MAFQSTSLGGKTKMASSGPVYWSYVLLVGGFPGSSCPLDCNVGGTEGLGVLGLVSPKPCVVLICDASVSRADVPLASPERSSAKMPPCGIFIRQRR